MMKKNFLLALLLFSFTALNTLQAQSDDLPLPKSFKEETPKKNNRPKLMGGGTFGLQFGSYTAVSISPTIGIYPTDWLLLGVGGSYMYSYSRAYGTSSNVFGFSAFAQGLLIKKRLILYAGYEYVNYDIFFQDYWGDITKERNDAHALFLGPGYRQPLSDNLSMYAMMLFDVIQSYDSFYANPVIRVGVIYDF